MSHSPVNIESYLHTYEQLQEAVEGLSDEQLKWKAAETQWSVTEVLTHLADHNIVVSFRIREVLAGSEVRLPAFSQDPWVAGQKANQGNAADVLEFFRNLLIYNSLLFRRFTPEDWNKTGVNFKGETVTIAAIVQAFIDHVQVHLKQIERIKQGEISSQNSSCTI
ncbi:DinB family protein [Cohnella cholangitidis]|uniref:DinB family protein n=1 Tax=Cohnella cholangitidis TaxID=2598458 RepID=A0A7G5C2Y1_9BACL|nr:DinB family protein [Cohnella cholangitidis]QMV43565.1 DinB family protein [Cohnella cholangitidis]